MYHLLNVACLTKFELCARDYACMWSLKQSCSICHGEQLLSLGHELIMCIAYSFGAHKNHQVNNFQHLANSTKSCTLTVLTADLWDDLARDWLRVWAWVLNKNWRWYLGLQFSFKSHSLNHLVLMANSTRSHVVRLGLRHWRTKRELQWPTAIRRWPLCGAGIGRVSPAFCPARQWRAKARL